MLKVEKVLKQEGKDKIVELRAGGLTEALIAEEINKQFGTELFESDIDNYIHKRDKIAAEVLAKKGDLNKEISKQYFDTIEQVKKLNQEIWKEYYAVKESPEYKMADVSCPHCNKPVKVRFKSSANIVKVADHLLKQIQHVDTILGRMQKVSALNVTYNIGDMTQKIVKIMPQILDKYENRGYITIRQKKKIKELAEDNEEL